MLRLLAGAPVSMSHSLSSSATNSSSKGSVARGTASKASAINGFSTIVIADNVSSPLAECCSTKKGVLWEQQQNRFFFNRWKERFFILTTDYLTCFKKGSKKVGMSEMGSFVYKVNLNEVKALTWVDKKKNGVICVQLVNTVIFLWNDSERLLDDWMVCLQESTNRTKFRREALRKSETLMSPSLLTASPSRLSSKDFTLSQRNNSPNILFRTVKDRTPTIEQHVLPDVVPPPPPPRRYLRCVSTDLEKLTNGFDDDHKTIDSPRGKAFHLSSGGANVTARHGINTFHKLSGPEHATNQRKHLHNNNNNNNNNFGPGSQSLRCKSSYAIQLSPLMMTNSPTMLQQQQQQQQQQQRRVSAAKRLSATATVSASQSSRPQSQAMFRCVGAQSHQSADSEFSFISSKAAPINNAKTNFDSYRNDRSIAPKNSYLLQRGARAMLTSSSSLVLNSRRKQWSVDDRRPADTQRPPPPPPPPPIPPHRTHLHHF